MCTKLLSASQNLLVAMHDNEAVFHNLSIHLRSVIHKTLCLLAQNSVSCCKKLLRAVDKGDLSSVTA